MLRVSLASRLVASLLLITMPACTTWQPYAPTGPTDTDLPTRVRFTLESGQSLELKRPQLEGDSVYVGEASPRRITRVSASSVISMQEGRTSVELTVLAIVGAIGLAIGFLALGACSTSDFC